AGLPWPVVQRAWALLMLAALCASAWAFGIRARRLPLLLPVLGSPPVLTSFSQLTPLWLLGLALAWRFRPRPGLAGAFVAMAALTKGMPLLSLVPLLRQRWRAALLGA